MKKLTSENPCNKLLFRRGGGYDYAFTMAEILLSLTIIGVVAAITLPSLTGNINERTWNTQRKALYARFSQAISLMPALNGYGTLDDTTDTAAETFVTAGLSKVLKINNICDNEHLQDCGITSKITILEGTGTILLQDIKTLRSLNSLYTSTYSYKTPDTKAAAFETASGESILVYYNPQCSGNIQETGHHYTQSKMCANFVYDLNGTKGPNTVGKDIGFITALYSTDSVVVAPMPLSKNAGSAGHSGGRPGELCRKQDPENRAPNSEELMSIFCNKQLAGMSLQGMVGSGFFWSISPAPSTDPRSTWLHNFNTGARQPSTSGAREPVRCVRR